MALIPIRAMVKKDLQVFFADRRAVIMAFAMPIAIASFFGFIFRPTSGGSQRSRLQILLVDQDSSAVSKEIVSGAQADQNLATTIVGADTASNRVLRGDAPVAVIIPPGFGDSAKRALLGAAERPQLRLIYDPSRSIERSMVGGVMMQHVMKAVTRAVFGDGPGPRLPFELHEEALTARAEATFNGFAHSFAGMGIQFLLFAAINLGIELLTERQLGLWKRLRSAPISRLTLLTGKLSSATVIGALVLFVSFAFAILVWHVQIAGSLVGFLGIGLACALMAAGYGLLVASLGKTPNAARGASIFATLIMVMLGGAWVPTFVFPEWLQNLTIVVPTRWAVDGFDAMTWRGLGVGAAVMPIVVLLGFAALFTAVAAWRFRWDEA